jgi:hypothetical protein
MDHEFEVIEEQELELEEVEFRLGKTADLCEKNG